MGGRGQALPLLPGFTWRNSQEAQISLLTLPSQSSALTSQSPLQKPPGAYSPKTPALQGTGTLPPPNKAGTGRKSVPHRTLTSPCLHVAGGQNSGLHSGSKLCSANLKSQTALLPGLSVTQQDGTGRAAVQVEKGSDLGLRRERPFPFPQAKQFSHGLGLCRTPFKKVKGPSKSLLGAARTPPPSWAQTRQYSLSSRRSSV